MQGQKLFANLKTMDAIGLCFCYCSYQESRGKLLHGFRWSRWNVMVRDLLEPLGCVVI